MESKAAAEPFRKERGTAVKKDPAEGRRAYELATQRAQRLHIDAFHAVSLY
jgi:hypothetical protein